MDITEDVSSSTDEASLNYTDQIADLLSGETEEPEVTAEEPISEAEEETDDLEEEETPTDESTEEVNDSEGDDTWETVLGVEEGQIHYDEEGNLAGINVKVNDKSGTVNMTDLIAGYQGNKAFTQKSQALAEERKDFDTRVQQVQQDYTSKLENVELLTNYLSDKLVQEFEGINWDQLRVENPAEYAAAKQDYASKAQELKQAQEAIAQEKTQQTEASNKDMLEKQQVYMKGQYEQMINNNPTWANKDTLKTDMDGLKSFASNQYGFSDQDFNTVTDARLIELIKDAKAFRDGVKVAAIKRKKPVPKFQKSRGKTKKPSKLALLTKKAKAATGSSKRELQTSAIAELLGG